MYVSLNSKSSFICEWWRNVKESYSLKDKNRSIRLIYKTRNADDSSRLVPEEYDVVLSVKLRHVLKWAEHNKMQVDMATTKEYCARNVLFPSVLTALQESYVLSCWVFGCKQICAWESMLTTFAHLLITFRTFVTSERTCSHTSKDKDYHTHNYKVFWCDNSCSCSVCINCLAADIDILRQLFTNANC